MTITQMQYFVAVCKYGSYTKAAESLFVSQPAVSQAIRELEEECGIPLIVRNGKKLVLTDEGKVLQAEMEIILRQVDQLNKNISTVGLSRNYVRIGLSTFSGNVVFPKICRQFQKDHPEIRLEIEEAGTRDLFDLLDKERVDLIITSVEQYLADPVKAESYMVVPLQSTSGLAFCVNIHDPAAKKKYITLKEISKMPLVMLGDTFPSARHIKEMFSSRGLQMNILLTTMQMYTIERFVEQGAASGFLPQEITEYNHSIVAVRYEGERSDSRVSMVWKKERVLYPSADIFIKEAQKVCRRNKSARN